jgi:hypothetical protein
MATMTARAVAKKANATKRKATEVVAQNRRVLKSSEATQREVKEAAARSRRTSKSSERVLAASAEVDRTALPVLRRARLLK